MNRNVILLLASIALWTAPLCAAPPSNEGKAFTASEAPPSTADNAQAPTGGGAAQPSLQSRNPRYRLCESDVFDLDFDLTPEFNQTVTVQPDGYITLRGIGDVHIAGQTVPEATESIRQAYSKILHDPVIIVALTDFNKPYFVVSGQVGKPGKYDLRGDTTVSEAVAIAGGFSDNAKHSQVLLFRRVSNDWVEVKKLDLKQMLQAANLSEDLHLLPGDMLFVPKNRVSKVRPWIPYPSLGMYVNPF